MKNVIVMLCLVALITGCSDSKDDPEQIIIEEKNEIDRLCEGYGINPKNIDKITSITTYGDSISYKIAGGRMGNDSWFAKFTPAGDEIFSYTIKATDGGKIYSHVNHNSIVEIDNNFLFLATWFVDSDEQAIISNEYNSILSVIDFSTGNELSKLPVREKIDRYNVYKSNNIYYVLDGRSGYTHISCIGDDGKLSWSRETTESEKNSGISFYTNYQILDIELILFFFKKIVDGFSVNTIKVINLHTYTLIFEILCDDIPFITDRYTEKGISYRFHKAEKVSDIINIYFGEYPEKEIIDDEIAGTSHTEYRLENEYYYSVRYPTGEVIGKF